MAETSAKSLMNKFLQMGTKSGGWTPATAPHWSRSSTSKGHKVIICMIWAATTKEEYNYDQITSTKLDCHVNMVFVLQHATIIN